MRFTEGDRLIEFPVLAVFVGQGREKAPRVFLVPFLEVVDPGGRQRYRRIQGGRR
jgi:hypothetical protein